MYGTWPNVETSTSDKRTSMDADEYPREGDRQGYCLQKCGHLWPSENTDVSNECIASILTVWKWTEQAEVLAVVSGMHCLQ